MKAGDYVRTKTGEIGKLVNVEVYYVLGQDDKDKYSCVLFNNSYIPCIVSNDFIVKKGELIDLIEVGDYVNGIFVEGNNGKYLETLEDDMENSWLGHIEYIRIYPNDIKSIVTKEQYESIEYKVSD